MAARLERDDAEIYIDGVSYIDVLARLHALRRPKNYFEIGSLYGDTLRLAQCDTLAVDPQFQLKPGVEAGKPRFQTYELTSDAFFAAHDPKAILGADVDFAFLDGMHEFPFLLRDFIGAEKACAPGSIIVMHDCLPRDAWQARRYADLGQPGEVTYGGWAGDVWKMTPLLRALRPDLKVTVLDAPPTGLVVIENLDPINRVLSDGYDQIMREWDPIDLYRRHGDWTVARLFANADVQSAEAWLAAREPQPVVAPPPPPPAPPSFAQRVKRRLAKTFT